MRKIAHIINPFKAKKTSDLHAAQPVVFESMKIAQRFAQTFAANKIEVELFSAQFPEDRNFVPQHLIKTKNLRRSILDVVKVTGGNKHRKLPLLKDILDRLYEASDAEYFIYTNSDIALLPHFYVAVNEFIDSGHKAFTITRRSIRIDLSGSGMYTLFSCAGGAHPGHDCFVFRRESYPKYRLYNMCVGMPHVGKVLLVNFDGIDKECEFFRDLHLTFHVGNSGQWMKDRKSNINAYLPYQKHNQKILRRVCNELKTEVRRK